jgi:hypothetical protein
MENEGTQTRSGKPESLHEINMRESMDKIYSLYSKI